jgi:hypothetical protein
VTKRRPSKPRCQWCGKPFKPKPGGRPALYCKPACRQRAYEKLKWTPYSETDALALDLVPAAAMRRLVAQVCHQHMVDLLKHGVVPLLDPAQIDGVLDPVGPFPTVILVANSVSDHVAGCRAAKREQRVLAVGVAMCQSAILIRLTAAAVMTCCKWVLARPI